MTATESGGSVVRRILLGSQLRRLREARGISREAAGYSIRASESKISRMELGRVSFKTRDIEDLLTLYGVTDERERTGLLGLAKEANTAGWWHSFNGFVPNWFPNYVGLEAAASEIKVFEVQFVHGLLQTEAYAQAVVTRGVRDPESRREDIDSKVALRLERQKKLVSEHPPTLHAVLDEGALHRSYGGNEVMRAQLEHLIEMSERPNVTIQVMPFDYSGHTADTGAFSVLTFPESDLSDIVYTEHLTSALYMDKAQEVGQYTAVMDSLISDCPDPDESRDQLRELRQLY
ncbi:Scr1 family TA system antitoxin-like transcriptional regulator [Streptomyces sp. DW26H14]|uniref:Scr1 family TA system antitoxin-like transcriptional regulator n=1 Tax=Streptomyces sp. DW26H14 TaxID=3435395 RepID=UPI00403D7600